jgi:macrolide transport system ATP-binding/permease protein
MKDKLAEFGRRLVALFRRRQFDADLEEEMRLHQELREQEQVERGVAPEEAHYAAKRRFGNKLLLREESRDMWSWNWLETFLQDIRYGLRQLRRSPRFTVVAVLVLALGIGASVAIFGFVDAALLEPLPYANPGRLMSVNESNVEMPRWPLSYPDYVDWQRLNKSFSSLDVYNGSGYLLRTSSGAEPVQGERVSGAFFRTLGVRPMLGRDFSQGEDRPDGPNVAILSYGAWLHRFGARRDAVGRTVDLDNRAYTIIGVLPRAFSFAPAGNAEFWVPLNSFSPHEKMRTFYNFFGIGRLRDGVSIQQAQAEMTAISRRLQREYGITGQNLSASVVPFSEIVIGDVRPILLTLLAGAGLLFLIASVNVASLVMARSEGRRHEIAMRGALGATRARLVRQFVTEGLLLVLLGGLAGVVVAADMMKLLGRLVPKDMASNMPFLGGVGFNVHTGEFAAATAFVAGLLLVVIPILRLSSQRVRDGLTGRESASRLWRRVGASLVIVELAIAVVLLAGAGLLGESLFHLLHVPLGFDPGHLATVSVSAPGTVYNGAEQMTELYREIVRRVSGLPGVESAGMTSMLPVECNCAIDRIHFPGRPYHGEHNDVDERHVSARYLATLKAGLVRGRFFTEADDASMPGVAVINQALARKYFPGQDPVGKRIANDEFGTPHTWEIVGVVDDVREGPLDVETAPAEYFPMNQTGDQSFSLVVRTRQDAGALLPELVSVLHRMNPNLGVSDEATMNEGIDATQAALLHRFSAWLVGGFAVLALVLGMVGLYGVIAYSVSHRTREIGIRMALGAQTSEVLRMVIGYGIKLSLAGTAIGVIAALGLTRLMVSLLFGVKPADPLTFLVVALVLTGLAVLACYVPARAAAKVDPMVALRDE